MFEKISKAIAALVSSVSDIQKVYQFEASNIEGFPAATITPSANENEYTSTTENRRTYAFLIRLYVVRPDGANSEAVCEETMRKLVDQVTDKLDRNFLLSSLQSQAGYTFLAMMAAPSLWGYTGSRENQMRVAEIRVQLHFDVDTTLISS